VLQYVEHDVENGKTHLAHLLVLVRPPTLSVEYLAERKIPLMKNGRRQGNSLSMSSRGVIGMPMAARYKLKLLNFV